MKKVLQMEGKLVRRLEVGSVWILEIPREPRLQNLGTCWMCDLRERQEWYRNPSLGLGKLSGWRCCSWDGEGRRSGLESGKQCG